MRPGINTENIYAIIKEKRVVTMEDLIKLSQCSVSTMRRRLKKWQASTSYNKNGKYYTLPSVAQFNQNGIWVYKNICFSIYGSLRKTIIELINSSMAGYNIAELNNLLHIHAQNFLSQQLKHFRILERKKHNGVYVYYSKDPIRRAKQEEHRNEMQYDLSEENLPSDANTIIILIEFIKHPRNTIAQLVKSIRRKRINISTKEVRSLFAHHKISKKNLVN